MQFIQDTTWDEVFDGWREREANDPNWIDFATTVKGWETWEEWRRFIASQMSLPNLNWQIFKFDNPMIEIPEMIIGPYSGWQSRLDKEKQNQVTFRDLLYDPEQYEYWLKHRKVLSMIENFPNSTQIIAIIREDLGKLVCIDGHHRVVAITLAGILDKEINTNGLSVAVARLPKEYCYLIEETLKRGSSKIPENS